MSIPLAAWNKNASGVVKTGKSKAAHSSGRCGSAVELRAQTTTKAMTAARAKVVDAADSSVASPSDRVQRRNVTTNRYSRLLTP